MIDGHDIADLEKRLSDALVELRRRTAAVAKSKQVKEFVSDMRKSLLARYKLPHIQNGESDAKADTYARSDANYLAELNTLASEYQNAEGHIVAFDVSMAKFEAARSLLSMAKAQLPSTHQQGKQYT